MFMTVLQIAPIFGLLVLGQVLQRGGIPSLEFWRLNDKLVYWVLMPSLLFYKTSTTNFDTVPIGAFALVILGGFTCAVVFGLLLWGKSSTSGAVASSVLQGSARHNTFIALTVAEQLFGAEGLALATLLSALLIPATNLSIVSLMVVMTTNKRGSGIVTAILRDLLRNPLLLAVGAGVICNLSVGGEVPVVHNMTRILGQAALPIVLLSVGASLQIGSMKVFTQPMILATIGKMIVFPLATFLLAQATDLTEMQTMIALLFAAAPTASSAYTLARQMGGDAKLMAEIITVQTGLSFLTIPATLWLVERGV
ncbi:AEC family transporter [Kiloniella antarctica]|uniref:AEC family transporter n=1 Tax=Kiloniella antarctica TaxID=1550907 RepID=A0ABW5BHX1_9PROT